MTSEMRAPTAVHHDTTQPPKLADLQGYNALIEREELALATRQYERAIERREALDDRVRFGALSLNGATLAALLGTFGNANSVLRGLGLSSENLKVAVIMLMIGMALAAISVWWSGVCYTKQAGGFFTHMYKRRHRAALMHSMATNEIHGEYQQALDETQSVPSFEFSKIDIWLRNTSGGCWLGAIAALVIPLLRSLWRLS